MTATAVPVLNDYRSRLADLPEDRFIGTIMWYSISQFLDNKDGTKTTVPVRVTRDQLEVWFEELDLNLAYLPPVIKKVDAFRKASTAAETSYPLATEGMTAKLRVEEIDYNNEFVLRHILRDVHDKRSKTSTTAHVATLKFMRGGRTSQGTRKSGQTYKHTINHTLVELGLDNKPTGRIYPLEASDRFEVEKLIAAFDARYTDLSANLHSDAIRAVVRSYLSDLNAIGVKPSGGVYFVHISRQKTVDALQRLVQKVGQGCTFHQLPLLNTLDQREMLTEAYQTEVQDKVTLLLKTVTQMNGASKAKGGKIAPADYTKVMDAYRDIASRSEEYTRVLGLAQGRAGSALDLALDAVIDMSGRLDHGKKP